MSESAFSSLVDEIFDTVEAWVEDAGLDVDFLSAGGMLTIVSEANGSQIILSRQSAVYEIWVATREGGYHFRQEQDDWICKTGETLEQLLRRAMKDQLGETPEAPLELPH